MSTGLFIDDQAVGGFTGGPFADTQSLSLDAFRRHERVSRYNATRAMFERGRLDVAVRAAAELARECYGVLGFTPQQVFGCEELEPAMQMTAGLAEDIRQLADCLILFASATEAAGGVASFFRARALKFYALAEAVEAP